MAVRHVGPKLLPPDDPGRASYKIAPVAEITAWALKIVVFFTVLAVFLEVGFLLSNATLTTFELIAVPICLFVFVPLTYFFARRAARSNRLPMVFAILYGLAILYVLGGLMNGLTRGLGEAHGLHYVIWLSVPFICAVATQPIRRAQILCWSGLAAFALVTIVFIVAEGLNPLTDTLALVLVQSITAYGAILALLYIFSVYREQSVVQKVRIDALRENAIRLARSAHEAAAARDVAEAAVAARDKFLANMSHELRTPLNAIIGFSDILKRELFGPHTVPRYGEYAADIQKSGEHLLSIISQILDHSRFAAGEAELDRAPVDLAAIAEEALHFINVAAQEKNLTLTLNNHLSSDRHAPPQVLGDRQALLQILLNLLSNAVKFTHQGKIETGLSARSDGGVEISVTDTGAGIEPALLPDIFEPFRRGNITETECIGGTGLGLSIVKSLVEAHGGSVRVESTLGAGTKVRIILPAPAISKQAVG